MFLNFFPKVEIEKYKRGVQWLQELLYQTQFVAERLKIVASKMMNDVARLKRDGRTIAVAALKELNFIEGKKTQNDEKNIIKY